MNDLLPKWGEHGQMKPDGFAKIVKAGDACRHRGTKDWARVVEVQPQSSDGSAELVLIDDLNKKRYWATYHVDYYQPAA